MENFTLTIYSPSSATTSEEQVEASLVSVENGVITLFDANGEPSRTINAGSDARIGIGPAF